MALNIKRMKQLNKFRKKDKGGNKFIVNEKGNDFVVNFGKHKGESISEMFDKQDNHEYLIWIYNLPDIPDNIVEIMDDYIEEYI